MSNSQFIIDFLPGNMTFFSQEGKRQFLVFNLSFSFKSEEAYEIKGEVLLNFDPKKKQIILSEFTLGQGFQHKELTLHDVLQVTNPLKVYVTEPGIEKKNHFLALWTQSGKEEDVLKLNAYNAWWEANFHTLLDAILMKKKECNQKIKEIMANLLID